MLNKEEAREQMMGSLRILAEEDIVKSIKLGRDHSDFHLNAMPEWLERELIDLGYSVRRSANYVTVSWA